MTVGTLSTNRLLSTSDRSSHSDGDCNASRAQYSLVYFVSSSAALRSEMALLASVECVNLPVRDHRRGDLSEINS